MKSNHKSPLCNQNKDNHYVAEIKIVYDYLQNNIATATMVSVATGVSQKNITRYKRYLEDNNMLWEVYKSYCRVTKHKAHYLTTDPEKAPKQQYKQLSLF